MLLMRGGLTTSLAQRGWGGRSSPNTSRQSILGMCNPPQGALPAAVSAGAAVDQGGGTRPSSPPPLLAILGEPVPTTYVVDSMMVALTKRRTSKPSTRMLWSPGVERLEVHSWGPSLHQRVEEGRGVVPCKGLRRNGHVVQSVGNGTRAARVAGSILPLNH